MFYSPSTFTAFSLNKLGKIKKNMSMAWIGPVIKPDCRRDGTRDSGGVTYSLDIGGDRTPVFCDHPVLYYYLE